MHGGVRRAVRRAGDRASRAHRGESLVAWLRDVAHGERGVAYAALMVDTELACRRGAGATHSASEPVPRPTLKMRCMSS